MMYPRVEQDSSDQRSHERRGMKLPIDEGESCPGRDRDHGRGIGERAKDLPGCGKATTHCLDRPEPTVVRKAPAAPRLDLMCRRVPVQRCAAELRAASAVRRADRHRHLSEERGRGQQLLDLALFLEDRLQERQVQPSPDVVRHRLRGDIIARTAQHERIEQIVGDQVAGGREVLGSPRRGDRITERGVEASPSQ